jgi:hypothetical protein
MKIGSKEVEKEATKGGIIRNMKEMNTSSSGLERCGSLIPYCFYLDMRKETLLE